LQRGALLKMELSQCGDTRQVQIRLPFKSIPVVGLCQK
jgi:hypothetical protein